MTITGSVTRTTITQFFTATAVLEATAGLAFLLTPALVITLLLASPARQTDVAIGRLAGAALLSLGMACWWARADAGSVGSPGTELEFAL